MKLARSQKMPQNQQMWSRVKASHVKQELEVLKCDLGTFDLIKNSTPVFSTKISGNYGTGKQSLSSSSSYHILEELLIKEARQIQHQAPSTKRLIIFSPPKEICNQNTGKVGSSPSQS